MRGGGNGRERGGGGGSAGFAGTEWTALSVRDPRGRGPREGARGGHGRGIAGDGRHVWGVQQFCEEVCLGPQHLDNELI
jgi:hypothetical protein